MEVSEWVLVLLMESALMWVRVLEPQWVLWVLGLVLLLSAMALMLNCLHHICINQARHKATNPAYHRRKACNQNP